MIDIEKAKNEFMKYVEGYDINSGRIRLKMVHILKVANNSRLIASALNLTEEEIKLAELIGIFHDIGRFEQVKIYNTFSDKDTGIDHAAYSLKVLYEDGLIKRFIDSDKYDEIIKQAVYNHNKAQIAENVEGKALLFSKIIRDADKLDIYRVLNESPMEDAFWYENFECDMTSGLLDKFKQNHFVPYTDVKNNADLLLSFYGYIFDLNFPYSLQIIKNNKYLEKFTIRVKDTFTNQNLYKKIDEILCICNDYIKHQCGKD